jgi:hypothetical protein
MRSSVGFSALVAAMVAFNSTPAPACEWHSRWDGCGRGCDHGYGMQAYVTHAPPIYAYRATPPVHYTPPFFYAPPVYYAPPVNAYGIHQSNYVGPRHPPYYGVQPHQVAARYDEPRKRYSESGDYSGRVATAVKARKHSHTADNHAYPRPLPTKAYPTGSVKFVQR